MGRLRERDPALLFSCARRVRGHLSCVARVNPAMARLGKPTAMVDVDGTAPLVPEWDSWDSTRGPSGTECDSWGSTRGPSQWHAQLDS